MEKSAFEDGEPKPTDSMTDLDYDSLKKVARKAVFGKHADSIEIKKEKMWSCFPVLNKKTERLNKIFQCNLCEKRFDKLSNV